MLYQLGILDELIHKTSIRFGRQSLGTETVAVTTGGLEDRSWSEGQSITQRNPGRLIPGRLRRREEE